MLSPEILILTQMFSYVTVLSDIVTVVVKTNSNIEIFLPQPMIVEGIKVNFKLVQPVLHLNGTVIICQLSHLKFETLTLSDSYV